MKTKLLLTFLITSLVAQAQVTDFLTGLTNEPSRLIIDNDIIYVNGVSLPGEIIEIDLANFIPSFNSLFTTAASSEIGGFIKDGDTFYIANVNSTTGESSIISFDINVPTVTTTIVSGLGFVAAIDILNDELYFSNEDLSGGGTTLDKIDITISNPSIETVVNGLTNPQDMEFNGSTLYIGDRDAVDGDDTGIIYSVDTSLLSPTLNTFISDVNVRGVYVFNTFLYFSDAGVIKKAPFANSSNITTEAMDTGSVTDFLRDVVISGTNLYMPQEDLGKIVTKEDLTLSTNDFSNQLSNVSIYNDKNALNIIGLNNQNHNVKIYNLTGSEIIAKNINVNENSIDISKLSNGIYLLNIDNQQTFKFVK